MYHVVVLLTLINKYLTILMRARGYRSEGNQLKGMNRWILPYRSLMKRKILGYSNSHHIERKHFEIDFRLTFWNWSGFNHFYRLSYTKFILFFVHYWDSIIYFQVPTRILLKLYHQIQILSTPSLRWIYVFYESL